MGVLFGKHGLKEACQERIARRVMVPVWPSIRREFDSYTMRPNNPLEQRRSRESKGFHVKSQTVRFG
jgi:hypothetical protein